MPIARSNLLGRRAPVHAVGVYALNGIPDPYQTSLYMSGLSVDPAAPGSPVNCVFTVAHAAPILDVEIFYAKDTFTGAVVDSASGIVVCLLGSQVVRLRGGQYVAVRLTSTTYLPSSEAGAALTVYVGSQQGLKSALVGSPLTIGRGLLSAQVTAEAAPDSSLPSQLGTNGTLGSDFSSWLSGAGTTIAVVAAGAAIVAGGVWVAGKYLRSAESRAELGVERARATAARHGAEAYRAQERVSKAAAEFARSGGAGRNGKPPINVSPPPAARRTVRTAPKAKTVA